MAGKFDIVWEAGETLMVIRCQGFWTDEDAQEFQSSVLNLLSLYKVGRFDMLVDLGQGLPQTAAVTARLTQAADSFMRRGLGRKAAFSQGAIVRTQVNRLFAEDADSRTFTDEAAARQWLSSVRQVEAAPAILAQP